MKTLTKEVIINNDEVIPHPILKHGNGWLSTELDSLSVTETGEKGVLLNKIISAINNAQYLICVQSFLFQDTALIDALKNAVVKRNVKVYVLSSADARLKDTIYQEEDFIKSTYIDLLNTKFKNHFIHRSSGNFHGKYIVIDPKHNAQGFICTNNFTDKGFYENPELAVQLSKEQCVQLYKVFVYHFWEHSTDEQNATNEFDKVSPAKRFELSGLKHILLTSPNSKLNILNDSLLEAITKAQKSISISTFNIDKDMPLVKAIVAQAQAGLKVTLFCRPTEKQFNAQLKDLLDYGVLIYFHPLIHAKSLVIDSTYGFIFTANLTYEGLETGLEVGVKLTLSQSSDLQKIHQGWEANFPYKALKESNIQDLQSYYQFKNGTLTEVKITDHKQVIKKPIAKVADLISFFNQSINIKGRPYKSIKVLLTAEFRNTPVGVNTSDFGSYQVVQLKETRKRKPKVIVLKNEFTVDDLSLLSEYKDLEVYVA